METKTSLHCHKGGSTKAIDACFSALKQVHDTTKEADHILMAVYRLAHGRTWGVLPGTAASPDSHFPVAKSSVCMALRANPSDASAYFSTRHPPESDTAFTKVIRFRVQSVESVAWALGMAVTSETSSVAMCMWCQIVQHFDNLSCSCCACLHRAAHVSRETLDSLH